MLLVLDSQSKGIDILLQNSPVFDNPVAVCSYADTTASSFGEGNQNTSISTGNFTTIVDGPPGMGIRRVIKSITISNNDAQSNTFYLYLREGATRYQFAKITLAANGASWSSDDLASSNQGGGVTDGSKGDIDVSSGGSVWSINAGVVTAAKLASDSVTTAKILDANITTAKLANNSVTDAKLAADSVTTAKILNANVTNAKLANSTITIAGTSTALGDSISRDTITGLSTTGIVSRAGANALGTNTLTQLMDSGIGSTSGSITYRGASAWLPLTAGTDGQVLTLASGLPSWATAGGSGGQFAVENATGGTVTVGQVGVINELGKFVFSNTRAGAGSWCVVVSTSVASGGQVTVARRGRAFIKLTANCSAGDKMILSTTNGSAEPIAYEHYNMFAVALTSGTSGNNVECVLYTGTALAPAFSSKYVYVRQLSPLTRFRPTIQSKSTNSIVYNTATVNSTNGNPSALQPNNQYTGDFLTAPMMFNETLLGASISGVFIPRSNANFLQVSDHNKTTRTITFTSNIPAGWSVGDTLNIRCPTIYISSTFSNDYCQLAFKDTTVVPAMTRGIIQSFQLATNSADAYTYSMVYGHHPIEEFGGGKQQTGQCGTTNLYLGNYAHPVGLVDRSFAYRSQSSNNAAPDWTTESTYIYSYLQTIFIASP